MNRAVYALALGLSAGLALHMPAAYAVVTDAQVQQLLDRIEAQDKRIADLEKAAQQQAAPPPVPAPVVAVAPSPAPAPATPSPSAWADKISLQGDFRYRFEQINQEISDDRNRQRIRARLALVARPQDNLQVGFGLTTSQGDDPISQNQTIGDNGAPSNVYLNLAYFNWTALSGLNVLGGQFKDFLYRPGNQGLLWDVDWNPEGVGVTYTRGPFFANLLGTWLESDSASASGKEFTYGAQVGATANLGDNAKLTGGVGYYHFDTEGKGAFYGADTAFFGNSFDPATNTYLYNYEELEAFAQLGFKLAGLPVAVYGDYVNNRDVDNYGNGWSAGVLLGQMKTKGSWQASYAYQKLEPDAVFGALTDSDFGGGGTDNQGYVLRGAYAITDRVNTAFSYFINTIDKDVGTEQYYDRLQLDLNFVY